MGILQTTLDFMHQKAETKDDGCYRIRGVAYRVKDGRVTHCGAGGEIYQLFGAFLTTVGTYDYWPMGDDVNAQKRLKKI